MNTKRFKFLLGTLFIIGFAFTTKAQVQDQDTSDSDTSFFNEAFQDDTMVNYRGLWDPDEMFKIRTMFEEGGQGMCIQVVDREHCCFAPPCRGIITSNFGWRRGRLHAGIDIDLETGDPIYAAFDGIIRKSGWNSGYGNYVIITHFNGLETLYGHMSALKMSVLQPVKAGQLIGLGGNTGHSRGSHLHFEIRYSGKPMNPKLLIDFDVHDLKAYALDVEHSATFSRSNYINEEKSIIAVMSDSAYKHQEERYEASRQRVLREQEKARQAAAKKKKAAAIKKDRERMKNSKVVYHKVKSGDTLYGIAKRYGTTVSKICTLNGISTTDILSLGQKIKVK